MNYYFNRQIRRVKEYQKFTGISDAGFFVPPPLRSFIRGLKPQNRGIILIYGPKLSGKTFDLMYIYEALKNRFDFVYLPAREGISEEVIDDVLDAYKEEKEGEKLIRLIDDLLDYSEELILDIRSKLIKTDQLAFVTGSFQPNIRHLIEILEEQQRSGLIDIGIYKPYFFNRPRDYGTVLPKLYPADKQIQVKLMDVSSAIKARYQSAKYIALRALSEYLSDRERRDLENDFTAMMDNIAVWYRYKTKKFFRDVRNLLDEYMLKGGFPGRYYGEDLASRLAEYVLDLPDDLVEDLRSLSERFYEPVEIDSEKIKEINSLGLIYLARNDSGSVTPIPIDSLVVNAMKKAFGMKVKDFMPLVSYTLLHILYFMYHTRNLRPLKNLEITLGKYEGMFYYNFSLEVDPHKVEYLIYLLDEKASISNILQGQHKRHLELIREADRFRSLLERIAQQGAKRLTTPILLVRDYDYPYDFFRIDMDVDLEEKFSLNQGIVTYASPKKKDHRYVGLFPAWSLFILFGGWPTSWTDTQRGS